MKKIIFSLAMIVAVGAVVAASTGAFFSDTETSEGNTFTAGAIDLLVDSEAHYNGMVCVWIGDGIREPGYYWQDEDGIPGNEVETAFAYINGSCYGTWEETDLGPEYQFFGYEDMKPGDWGENTISLHVENNDAYVCVIIDDMIDNDNGLTEPEEEDGDLTGGDGEGELSQEIRFFAWADYNGNNIWEVGEDVLFSNEEGPASDVIDGVVYDLFTPATVGPLSGDDTVYVGLYWCYGDITVDYAYSTLSCDGSLVDNVTQTDSLEADFTFYVEQARHNDNFVCPPVPEVVPVS